MQKSSNEAFKSPFVCQCPAPCTFLFCSFCVLSDLGEKTFLINLTWIPSCQTYHWFLFRFTSAEREKLSELKWEAPLCWYFCLPSEQNETRSFCLQSQLSCNVRHWSAVSCRTGLFGWTICCLLEIKPCRICSFKVAMESFFTYCRYHLSWAAL